MQQTPFYFCVGAPPGVRFFLSRSLALSLLFCASLFPFFFVPLSKPSLSPPLSLLPSLCFSVIYTSISLRVHAMLLIRRDPGGSGQPDSAPEASPHQQSTYR